MTSAYSSAKTQTQTQKTQTQKSQPRPGSTPRLTLGEEEIVIRLLKARLKEGVITYAETRLLLKILRCREADPRATRLKQEVHRVIRRRLAS